MISRAQIEASYHIDPETSVICSPGKFEAEASYTPYFWETVLDGGAEHTIQAIGDDYPTDLVRIDARDRSEYPELIGFYGIAIWSDEFGFVYSEPLDQAEFEQLAELGELGVLCWQCARETEVVR